MSLSIAHIVKRLTRLIPAALAFFITIELCARIDDYISYEAPILGSYDSDILRTNDEDGVRHNVPNVQFEKWRNNNVGFRGEDISIEKPDTVCRVVCLGTSETYGLYESENMEWPAQLQSMLGDDSGYEVLNASSVGLPLRHYKRYIERYILPVDPDVVVLVVSPHMYAQGIERAHSRARIQAQQSSQDNVKPAEAVLISVGGVELRSATKFKQAVKGMLPNSWLKAYGVWVEEKRLAEEEHYFLNGNDPLDNPPDSVVLKFQRDVGEVVEMLQSRDVAVVLTTYPYLMTPNNLDEFTDLFLAARRQAVEYSYTGMMAITDEFHRALFDLGKQYGVGVVDLYSAVPQSAENFADNVHYTDAGATKVATAMHQYFSTHPNLCK